jgi:hypothetical protein
MTGRIVCSVLTLLLLSACAETVAPNGTTGTPPLMAQAKDTWIVDRKPLYQRQAAIAVDPDGCQAWIIDDGAEGYAGRRRDPVSGLPVCGHGTPGYVYGEPRANSFPDILPN